MFLDHTFENFYLVNKKPLNTFVFLSRMFTQKSFKIIHFKVCFRNRVLILDDFKWMYLLIIAQIQQALFQIMVRKVTILPTIHTTTCLLKQSPIFKKKTSLAQKS